MSRTRAYRFTLFAGGSSLPSLASALKEVECQFLVFQEETGEGGRDHLQGFIYFANAKTMRSVKNLMPGGPNLGTINGSISSNARYASKCCTEHHKAGIVAEGPPHGDGWNGGIRHTQGDQPNDTGVRSSLADACATAAEHGVKRCAIQHPEAFARYHAGLQKIAHIEAELRLPAHRQVTVIYVWGPSGCGKSWFAEHYDNREDTHTMGDTPEAWFDGYENQRTLVIEEFHGQMPYRELLRTLDSYRVNLKIKGGFVWGQYTTVILTSNQAPEHAYGAATDAWSFDPRMPISPFQRRISAIHHGTGVFPNTVWDIPPAPMPPPVIAVAPAPAPPPPPVADPVEAAAGDDDDGGASPPGADDQFLDFITDEALDIMRAHAGDSPDEDLLRDLLDSDGGDLDDGIDLF